MQPFGGQGNVSFGAGGPTNFFDMAGRGSHQPSPFDNMIGADNVSLKLNNNDQRDSGLGFPSQQVPKNGLMMVPMNHG